jgi:hypothetical protein
MRRFLVTLAILSVLSFSIAGIALAADPHTGGTTGQPSMTCEDQSSNPGGTVAQTNAGAPFDNSTGVSGNVYANGPDNGHTATAVSQYDVACFQVSQPGHP